MFARKDRNAMVRLKSMILLVSAAAIVGTAHARPRHRSDANRSLDSLNQPVVQRTDYMFDVATGSDGVSAGERARLDEWFASLGLGYADRVFIDDSGAGDKARRDIARIAADYGLLVSDGAPITAGPVQPGTARVIVSRSTASVPGCPHYRALEGPSATSSNYGCAVNSNLAAMVADPSDLVLGQAGSGTDARTASKAIKVYREAEPTGKKGLPEVTTRGKQ
jgi:pilus assembly protein CpaD